MSSIDGPWDSALWQTGLSALTVAHHVPGRIRLKLHAAYAAEHVTEAQLLPFASLLNTLLEQTTGIRAVRLNPLARSCVVEYEVSVIPMEAWVDLLQGVDSVAANVLKAHLLNSYQEVVRAQL